MAKTKIELKVNTTSTLIKFVNWFQESKGSISDSGRKMKGRSNDFLIRILEGLCENSGNKEFGDDLEIFKEFSQQKNKSPEQVAAEKAFANDAEKLKTWNQLQKDIEKAKKK